MISVSAIQEQDMLIALVKGIMTEDKSDLKHCL